MAPHEPYWRTNTSFSPPPPRWDLRFQSEGLSYGSHDGIQLYGSSTSSNSKESGSWLRGNLLYNHQYSASDGTGLFLSSPSELSHGPQWTPPAIQEISLDDYDTRTRRGSTLYHLTVYLHLNSSSFHCQLLVTVQTPTHPPNIPNGNTPLVMSAKSYCSGLF
ncbi:hypothetical protein SLE2022_334610 [Rubroshorea leprosula]